MKTIEELVKLMNEQAPADRKEAHIVNNDSGVYKPGKFCWVLDESYTDGVDEAYQLVDVNYGHLGAVINGLCLFTNGQILNHENFVVLDKEYYGTKHSIYKGVSNNDDTSGSADSGASSGENE